MHEQCCPIGLIHPIGQKFLYFEKTRMTGNDGMCETIDEKTELDTIQSASS